MPRPDPRFLARVETKRFATQGVILAQDLAEDVMHKWLLPALMGVLLVSLPQGRADDNEAKTVIDKAIKAHGGEDNLVKLQQVRVKSKGTMTIMGMGIRFTSDVVCLLPKKS